MTTNHRPPTAQHCPPTTAYHRPLEHWQELWETLQNPTTFYLLVFVSGNSAFAQLTPITYTYIQYTLVNLTNLMAGAQVIFTYLAVAGGIRIFQVRQGGRKRERDERASACHDNVHLSNSQTAL